MSVYFLCVPFVDLYRKGVDALGISCEEFLTQLCENFFNSPYSFDQTIFKLCSSRQKFVQYFEKYYFFKKNGPIPASFSVYFRLFNMLQFKFKFKLKKA